MKRKNVVLLFIDLLFLGLMFSSCGKDKTPEGSISFEKEGATIQMGEQLVLNPIFSSQTIKFEDCEWTNLSANIVDMVVNNANKSVTITGKQVGSAIVKIKSNTSSSTAIFKIDVNIGTVSRWVAFGNSITRHGITPYWWGEWGMAATGKAQDYIHVLNSFLENKFKKVIAVETVNIGPWELNFSGYDKNLITPYLTGAEDLIVLRLGENVPDNDNTYAVYEKELTDLLKFIKGKSAKATIVITGNFWTNSKKDVVQKKVADQNNCIWVPLKQLDLPENKSTLSTQVFGADNKWHLISEGGSAAQGVANHPNDKGMYNIAEAIYKSIVKF